MNTRRVAEAARESAATLAVAPTERKNAVLLERPPRLGAGKAEIVRANEADMADVKARGVAGPLYTRLLFDEPKIEGRIRSLEKIAALPDPVGQVIRSDRSNAALQCASPASMKSSSHASLP